MTSKPVEHSIFVVEALSALGEALARFGTYSFDDKGPSEVMRPTVLVDMLRKMSSSDAAQELIDLAVATEYQGRPLQLAEYLVHRLEDWNELFTHPGIVAIYNAEMPTPMNKDSA